MSKKLTLILIILIKLSTLSAGHNQQELDSLLYIISTPADNTNLFDAYQQISQIATVYTSQHKPDSALLLFNIAFKYHNDNKDVLSAAEILHKIAWLYELSGEYSISEKYLYKAKINYSILNDTVRLIYIEKSFADIYGKQRRFNDAILIYKKIIQYYLSEKKYVDLGQIYSNMGVMYEGVEEYNKALVAYKKSLKYVNISNNKDQMAITMMNIGSIYFELERYDSVLFYYDYSRTLFEQNNNLLPLMHNLLLTGNYYDVKKQFRKTKEVYLKAYNLAKNNLKKNYIMMASESLSMVYEDLNDYKNALKYAKIYKIQYDSLINNENIREQTIAEEGYKYKLQLLLKEKEIDIEKQKKKWLFIIASSILLSLGLLFFYRRKIQKNKLLQAEHETQIKIQNTKLQTQKEERKRVANILHDNLAHVISNTYTKIRGLFDTPLDDKLKQILLQVKENLDFMNKIAKVASYELEFSFIIENNLVDQFEKYIQRIQHSQSSRITLQHSKKNQFEDLQNEIKINIFSVFQEMLGNAIKYSKALHISVLLFKDGNQTILQVEDDGIGFSYDEVRHGQGFPNMTERAAKLNAVFTYESEKGFGTKLKFVVEDRAK